jgi:hypothetical protein
MGRRPKSEACFWEEEATGGRMGQSAREMQVWKLTSTQINAALLKLSC